MKNKILIIDGTYLAYRSFFAMNTKVYLTNNEGKQTNTTYLFLKTILNLFASYKPTHIFIAFDSKEKTFRHKMYNEYKSGRIKMPDEFYEQINLTRTILSYLKIENIDKVGFEADDLIAKICKTHENEEKIIFSADQDLNQLIDKKTSIIKKHKNEIILLTKNNFKEIYDFEPYQVIDYKAIVGDSSDNFFGVKGIGPKTACKLLSEYKNLENIYNNLINIKETIAKKFIEYKENAFRDQKIARLVTDFELNNIELENLDINNIKVDDETIKILDNYQLYSIKNALLKFKK
ncbi:5'-3' exonuclease [Metamycoplasma canadense]|uniref:5'-3' exonuclease n=1 Tax=Metamycoplasma canadense TaxID=29554 RepID=A0A077L9B2_9BACT|nr:5'-3' exonuclease [Metamycoplasma canadense]BAP39623.1 DNA polymerase I, 5'-3' exonuclease domain protein [Metamycoplasma canadense]